VWVELTANYQRDYTLTIIERVPMQQVIRADGMAAALNKDGFVALDIHFATDKAEILPESRPIIDEIVSLLKNRPDLRIGVETLRETLRPTRRYQMPAQKPSPKPSPKPGLVLTVWIRWATDRSDRLPITGPKRAGRRTVAWSW
jgi:hypothetical protein